MMRKLFLVRLEREEGRIGTRQLQSVTGLLIRASWFAWVQAWLWDAFYLFSLALVSDIACVLLPSFWFVFLYSMYSLCMYMAPRLSPYSAPSHRLQFRLKGKEGALVVCGCVLWSLFMRPVRPPCPPSFSPHSSLICENNISRWSRPAAYLRPRLPTLFPQIRQTDAHNTDASAATVVADGAAGHGPDGVQRRGIRRGDGTRQPLARAQGGLYPLRGVVDGDRVLLAKPLQPAGEQGHVAVNP